MARKISMWAKSAGEYYRKNKGKNGIESFSDVLKSPDFKNEYYKKYDKQGKTMRRKSKGMRNTIRYRGGDSDFPPADLPIDPSATPAVPSATPVEVTGGMHKGKRHRMKRGGEMMNGEMMNGEMMNGDDKMMNGDDKMMYGEMSKSNGGKRKGMSNKKRSSKKYSYKAY
jgi:hypothetical protein